MCYVRVAAAAQRAGVRPDRRDCLLSRRAPVCMRLAETTPHRGMSTFTAHYATHLDLRLARPRLAKRRRNQQAKNPLTVTVRMRWGLMRLAASRSS